MRAYNDTFNASDQIDAEERIAALLFDDAEVSEEQSADLGRQILRLVLAQFRPDLFRPPYRRNDRPMVGSLKPDSPSGLGLVWTDAKKNNSKRKDR